MHSPGYERQPYQPPADWDSSGGHVCHDGVHPLRHPHVPAQGYIHIPRGEGNSMDLWVFKALQKEFWIDVFNNFEGMCIVEKL